MYWKLAIQNIRRSLRDYIIYFVTLTLTAALMYSFLALGFSSDPTNCWFGSAIDIHEKSAPTSIPTEMNSSSRLKITLFDMSDSPFLIGIHFQSGRYTT